MSPERSNHVPPLTAEEIERMRQYLDEQAAMRVVATWAWKVFLFLAALATLAYNFLGSVQEWHRTASVKIGAMIAGAGIGLGVFVLAVRGETISPPPILPLPSVRIALQSDRAALRFATLENKT